MDSFYYWRYGRTNSITLSKEQYASIKQKVDVEQSKINQTKKRYEQNRARHNRDLNAFNRLISKHKSLIRQHNSLVIRIESLSESITEVKGKAIGKNITLVKINYQDGKTIVEKENRDEMEK